MQTCLSLFPSTFYDGVGRPEILPVASEKDIIGDVDAAPGIKKA
jgi:hypothetical protein